VFVLVDAATPAVIIGYFTLCATALDQGDVPEAARKHVPRDLTPAFHPAVTRDRLVLSRMSAGEATGGVNPARCFSRPAANAAGVA
jgi:hypothetical protein